MKAQSIKQFKIIEFLRINFDMEHVMIEAADEDAIMITDYKGNSMVFVYKDGKIVH